MQEGRLDRLHLIDQGAIQTPTGCPIHMLNDECRLLDFHRPASGSFGMEHGQQALQGMSVHARHMRISRVDGRLQAPEMGIPFA